MTFGKNNLLNINGEKYYPYSFTIEIGNIIFRIIISKEENDLIKLIFGEQLNYGNYNIIQLDIGPNKNSIFVIKDFYNNFFKIMENIINFLSEVNLITRINNILKNSSSYVDKELNTQIDNYIQVYNFIKNIIDNLKTNNIIIKEYIRNFSIANDFQNLENQLSNHKERIEKLQKFKATYRQNNHNKLKINERSIESKKAHIFNKLAE